MRYFQQGFDFFINSSIHVALSVYALSWMTLLEFQVPYDKEVLYAIFFATISGYNFVKYFGLAKFHHRRLENRLKWIQILSFISFILMIFYVLKLHQTTLIVLGVFGIITFLYAIPFLPKRLLIDKHHNLRSISGIKIHVIALVWSGVTVMIPLLNNDYEIDIDVIIVMLQRFVFVMVLMLPFEIRDLQYDSLRLSTIPQKIGVKPTKIMGLFLLLIFYFLNFFKDEIQHKLVFLYLVIAVITTVFLLLSRERQAKFYSSFWVESIPIIWLVLTLIL
uniref:hypothetical protein n=1 Tax=Gelidibacter sp. TaxID=2018083 RepID=UPI004049A9BC